MKNIIIVIGFLFISNSIAFANKCNKNYTLITISGYISDQNIKSFDKLPEIWYYDHFNINQANSGQILPVIIKNNKFTIRIKPNGEVGYFKFRGKYINSICLDLFLVQPGDSIYISMNSNGNIHFTGKGIEKIQFQQYVGTLKNNARSKNFMDNDAESIPYYVATARENLKLAMDSLKALSHLLPNNVYNVLKYNTASEINSNLLVNLSGIYGGMDSNKKVLILDELALINRVQTAFATTDYFVIDNSFVYTQYLFDFQKRYYKLLSGDIFNSIPCETVYNVIKKNFDDLLRDKLIELTFLNYAQQPGVNELISNALSVVKDSACLNTIKQFKNARMEGEKAFNFSFEDSKGKKITLNDLKGKVVILDTWFNGCLGCVGLARRMEPIIDKYKNNPDIIFLGVNVDQDRKRFIDGMNSGLYGAKQTVYAFTSGKGQHDPFLLYYQYSSFPNLLLIDKQGYVISSNPVRPIDNKTTQEFMNLIDKNL
ncbi:hypothetical protein AQ505_12820 [Pedobacter sp. PACM 27299]|uniref:TlpA family protein disulfide reductase n=1 Tax=Pedobacter sp. PACM 27299 TaxID=1727164 RepID=UPI000706019F|nr:TlpA disulfide reductase family protein [Pedobacter sp. PACM 27299]ALL06302.1 hypothetical protein AQ505_12820 [Pedobacter sp. PACM 27299]